MPRLTLGVRWRIVSLRTDAGWSLRQIAQHLHVSIGGVRGVLRVFEMTEDVIDRPRCGRPRVTQEDDDDFIINESRQHPFEGADQLRDQLRQEHRCNVSRSTVSRRLRAGGQFSYRAFHCLSLTAEHRDARLNWAQQHLHWSAQRQWRQVIFSDESRFCVHHVDGRLRVRRARDTRYTNLAAAAPVVPFGGGSVMVWGAISWRHRSALILIEGSLTGQRYFQEILEEVAIPFGMESVGQGFIFQDDNARPHRAAVVEDFHERNMDYVHMRWPSRSPDLNPIEHAWDLLGRAVRMRRPNNVEELKLALMQEWANLPQAKIQRLIRSMRSRCQSVIDANGGPTRY